MARMARMMVHGMMVGAVADNQLGKAGLGKIGHVAHGNKPMQPQRQHSNPGNYISAETFGETHGLTGKITPYYTQGERLKFDVISWKSYFQSA
jgi:hypothetical protein